MAGIQEKILPQFPPLPRREKGGAEQDFHAGRRWRGRGQGADRQAVGLQEEGRRLETEQTSPSPIK